MITEADKPAAAQASNRLNLVIGFVNLLLNCAVLIVSRDSLVVRTSRCGRDNPGSNPGHGRNFFGV